MLTVSLVSMGQNECVVNMEKSGKLGSVVNKKEIPNITKLTIKGGSGIELNEKDWKIIQKMTSLETLDITGISKRISYIPMNDKIGGEVIPNVKHLIVFEGEITPAYHESKENQYKRDMKEFWDIATDCDLLKWKFDYLGDIKYFPDLETIEIKNNVHRDFSIAIPEIMYASNYNHKWRGGIKKDGTLFIERKDVAKNFKGYQIVSEHSFVDNYLEGGFSQALYIDGSCEKYATQISSLTIPSCLRYIDYNAFNNKFNRGMNITFENGDDLLYINSAFNIITNKVLTINRPVYLDGGLGKCYPDTIIFNKDVECLSYLSAKNIVFKKIPKKIEDIRCGESIVSPLGSEQLFISAGVPSEKLFPIGGKKVNFNIRLEQPNTLLSHLPLDQMAFVDSLTISGTIYDTELEILKKCKNMRYLDLSRAYTTYSPRTTEKKERDRQMAATMIGLIMLDADMKRADYRMSKTKHAAITEFGSAILESTSKIKNSDKDCIIPEKAFNSMRNLETVILPVMASEIKEGAFSGCASLKNVVLPPYLKVIEKESFTKCPKLDRVEFPKTLNEFGSECFTHTALRKIDVSHCRFADKTWLLYSHDMPNLKELRLPQGITYTYIYAIYPQMSIYVPKALQEFGGEINDCYLYFQTTEPPKIDPHSFVKNSTIYIPKGATTAYYTLLGDTNNYIEE